MRNSATLVTLFVALSCGGVAAWIAWGLASCCLDAWRLRDAVVVEATIGDVERRIESVGDGTRERVYVTYAYTYEGRRHEHRTRHLTLFGNDSALHATVDEALRTNRTVPCLVARSDPSLSRFSREFSVPRFLATALFPLFFGAVAVLATVSLVTTWWRGGTDPR